MVTKNIIINKTFYYVVIFLSLNLASCSDETPEEPDGHNDFKVTNYIYKTYNVSNIPHTIIDSINYQINDNRIIQTSGINFETSDEKTSIYTYSNSKITNILSYVNNTLNRVESYTYNSSGDLIEYLSESLNTINETSSFNRHTFNHTTDTIFSIFKSSNDGVNFNNEIANYKIVLDANDNRIYFEEYDYFNNEIESETITYDTNSNIVNESKYNHGENSSDILSFENNYIYNTSENLFNAINEATYTRKNLMLLFHLQSDAVNRINAKGVSKNIITEFQSTWGSSFANFEIINMTDENNNTILSDFKTIISGDTFDRFSQEYIIQ